MRLSLFDFQLPQERIAQHPMNPRDHSRLFVFDRKSKRIEHTRFYNLPSFLHKGDVLVFNNSFVFPARLIGKKDTGGLIEVFLLNKQKGNKWNVLLGAKRKKIGTHITFQNNLSATVTAKEKDTWVVSFSKSGKALDACIDQIGEAPIPPYIKDHAQAKAYQTEYADPKKRGSVAAPTAGFHFTKTLLRTLNKRGIQTVFVTLHVGLGTFTSVKEQDITKHLMHEEYVEVDGRAVKAIQKAKKEGRRVIAVGTTSVRVLESLAKKNGFSKPYRGWMNIFIYPGFTFRVVDGMITNFHLPKSTLFMLVSAFAGRTAMIKAYRTAIQKKYRFYSFGDALFLT